jgi:DUF971 family protein
MRAADFQAVDGGRALHLAWVSGYESRIAARLLWAECPSAQGRRRRIDGRRIYPASDLAIVRVTPIGNYALNLAFSDGHDRGVYPWALLSELARRPTLEDFITPAAADAA